MKVVDRFLQYARIFTTSSEESGTHPSTKRQFDLARLLVNQLQELGLQDVKLDEHCYVYATLPATTGHQEDKVIGFISHMDTAAYNGENVRPRLVKDYQGEDIVLNEELHIVMKPSVYPELLAYKGQDLIVTDGTTLLGADDKAGIAEIMTAIEEIISREIPHGTIRIAFTPDEEIGEGADFFDVKEFGAEYAYTVDGGALGELEYENFNAASAKLIIHGVNIHPGDAKDKMVNAALVAMEFNAMLPANEIPAHTEGYEGFYHLTSMSGNEEMASLSYIIRDHDRHIFEERKHTVKNCAARINASYGEGTAELKVTDSYYNMKQMIEPHMEIVERAKKAFRENQVEPKVVPIRGGTDGARLSYMGLPCPNLSTGGHNFHGPYEYIPVPSMEKMTQVLISLMKCED